VSEVGLPFALTVDDVRAPHWPSLLERPAWQHDAACRHEPAVNFFPARDGDQATQQIAAARRVCATCAVALDCCAFALAEPAMQGVWAGTTPKQRQHARRDGWTAARLLNEVTVSRCR
jgi:WhiB family redox-sensing transcriptional regulator